MTDLPQTAVHQCQCAQCRASRAIDVLRALPALTGDGRAALDTIEAALNELNENGFARWEAMNDVAVAAGLNWMDATQQDIVDAIKQARAATLATENKSLRESLDAANASLEDFITDAVTQNCAIPNGLGMNIFSHSFIATYENWIEFLVQRGQMRRLYPHRELYVFVDDLPPAEEEDEE